MVYREAFCFTALQRTEKKFPQRGVDENRHAFRFKKKKKKGGKRMFLVLSLIQQYTYPISEKEYIFPQGSFGLLEEFFSSSSNIHSMRPFH